MCDQYSLLDRSEIQLGDMRRSTRVAVATWRPDPTPSVLLADAVEIRAIVSAAREHLGMDVAFIGEFHEGVRINRFIECGEMTPPMTDKSETLLEETYCRRIVAGEMPELMPDVSAVPAAQALAVTHKLRIGAYIGVPIYEADGTLYGTFSCFRSAREPVLQEQDARVMRLLAAMLSRRLEGERARDRDQRSMAARLDAALALGDPAIVFQPIVDLSSRASIGYEALARFAAEPARPVDAWFTDATRLGRGVELEIAAIQRAFAASGPLDHSAFISVNLSPTTLADERLTQALEDRDLSGVVFEITEHVVVEDYPALRGAIAGWRRRGVRLAIDDAGAGYASLRHVLSLAPDYVKLDLSLVRDIDTDLARQAMATALVSFAAKSETTVVAEGIETEAEMTSLISLGVTSGQGYFMGRPASAAAWIGERLPREVSPTH
jgi:EAL domain-containing protein (putative c-di-GMP-specific phosphodiesterase class I)